MQSIPKTFCPAKWDELYINLNYKYAYACCKSAPLKFVRDYREVIAPQQQNLLNGVQDPSCDYCWKLENAGGKSLRHEYLKKIIDIDSYLTDNVAPSLIEVNLGNECNFQCTYCNPKFSSKWEKDVRTKAYPVFTDRHFYGIDAKEEYVDNIELLNTFNNIRNLTIVGGEPLQNKNFWTLLDSAKAKNISVCTNLSNKNFNVLDQLLGYANKFNLLISVSLDSTGDNAEFTRYGLDFDVFTKNLHYLLSNSPDNVTVTVRSLMTSITIQDLENLTIYMKSMHKQYPKLLWYLSYCKEPVIQSFSTLKDKESALTNIQALKSLPFVEGVLPVESALNSYTFNDTLYKQLQYFLKEFSKRKNIDIPL